MAKLFNDNRPDLSTGTVNATITDVLLRYDIPSTTSRLDHMYLELTTNDNIKLYSDYVISKSCDSQLQKLIHELFGDSDEGYDTDDYIDLECTVDIEIVPSSNGKMYPRVTQVRKLVPSAPIKKAISENLFPKEDHF